MQQEAVYHLTPFRVHGKELITLLLLCKAPLGHNNFLKGTPPILRVVFDYSPSHLPQDDLCFSRKSCAPILSLSMLSLLSCMVRAEGPHPHDGLAELV